MATWTAGQKPTAQSFEDLVSAWASYTPAWTASTTNPTLGNGTLVGRYKQIGKTVHFTLKLTVGSTTTVGSGLYSWSLPVAASGSLVDTQCPAYFFDTSAAATAQHYLGMGLIQAGGTTVVRTRVVGGNVANVSIDNLAHNYPFAPATSDQVVISGTYESA